jgi:hypothetical protein
MKRFMLTVALSGVLTASAFAGEIPTCGVVATTSHPAIASTPAPGDMPTTGATSPAPENTQGPDILEMVILVIITWPR